jgi:hypothetical protein
MRAASLLRLTGAGYERSVRHHLVVLACLISGCIFYIPPPDAGAGADAGLDGGDAGATCNAATCPTGCCGNGACITSASLNACGSSGAVCLVCDGSRADRCANGACQCGSAPACAAGLQCIQGTCTSMCGGGPLCAAGQRCVNGACVCDASSCPTGCCDGTTCRAPSMTACGTAGARCLPCDSTKADRCEAGTCRCGIATTCATSCSMGTGSVTTTAVSFNDQQDRLVVPSAAWPTSTTNWTFAAWVRLAADRNEFSAFFTLEQPAGHSTEYNELVTLADGTTLVLWDHANGAAITLGQLTVGTWYFAAVSVGPNGAATAWFAPQGGTLSKRTGTVAIVDHVEMSYVGASNFAFTEFIDGSMAMARLWNGVLTDAEVAAEFTALTPRRTTGLLAEWRLSSASTVGRDSSGLGHDLVLNGGATHGNTAGPTISGSPTPVCVP